jgi:Mg2+/Co2+ transporter CorB
MTAEGWSLLVAAVLVVAAAFLVAAETAIARVSRARVEELEDDGVSGAARLLTVLEDRARYVNVLLFLHMLLLTAATVLVTRAFLVFIPGPIWWQLLAAALVMVVAAYVLRARWPFCSVRSRRCSSWSATRSRRARASDGDRSSRRPSCASSSTWPATTGSSRTTSDR